LAAETQRHQETAVKTTFVSLLSNISLAIIKWIGGYFGNSYALIADAIESTSDVVTSVFVLFGLKYAAKPADDNHPYGHGRIEPLITFLVVLFLVVSAGMIAYQSIHNIVTPHDPPQAFTLIILLGIIGWKEISYQWVIRKSRETQSSSLKADAWHHRSDAITSIAAFIGIAIALFFGKGFESADDWAALVASIFILYNCYLIFRPAFGEMMDEHVYDELIDQIRSISQTVNGVQRTEKCFVRKAGFHYHVDLHLEVIGSISVTEGHEIAHDVKDTLRNELPQLGHVLIHVEPSRPETED
jgi:cation diffusion facilitator family transporter